MPADVKLLPSQSSLSSISAMPVSARDAARNARARARSYQRTTRHATSGTYIEWSRLFRRMTGAFGIASVVAVWVVAAYLTILLRHV
jgi:hypothetical protein